MSLNVLKLESFAASTPGCFNKPEGAERRKGNIKLAYATHHALAYVEDRASEFKLKFRSERERLNFQPALPGHAE